MNWYRTVKLSDIPPFSSPYRRYNKEQLSKKKIRFANYLKTHGGTITMYHGTSQKLLDEIIKSGFFKSPKVTKTEDYETRESGLNQVFLTSNKFGALTYAGRALGQTDSPPIIVELEIPLYMLTEIMDPIFSDDIEKTHNEFNIQHRIQSIINTEKTDEEKLQDLRYYINNFEGENEFTIYLILSTRFIKKIHPLTPLASSPMVGPEQEMDVSDSIEMITEYMQQMYGQPPEFTENWCASILESGQAPKEWIDIINERISDEEQPPLYSWDWCEQQLYSGQAPQEWLNIIDNIMQEVGCPPFYFADQWCTQKIESGQAPQSWIDGIFKYIQNNHEFPTFLSDNNTGKVSQNIIQLFNMNDELV